jgi:hypothetical protein
MMAPVTVQEFTATIESGGEADGTTAFLELPAEVVVAVGGGRKRPPVRVTLNGYTYRSTVAVYGGKFYVPVRREVREAAGVRHREPLVVRLEPDDDPREVEVPEELAAALASEPDAGAAFARLSFSNRKEYADWVGTAKREETRRRRVGQAVEMLRAGVRTPKG